MTRFFEVFSKRVVKKARKCGPIERFHRRHGRHIGVPKQ